MYVRWANLQSILRVIESNGGAPFLVTAKAIGPVLPEMPVDASVALPHMFVSQAASLRFSSGTISNPAV